MRHTELENPFNHNYVFKKEDVFRSKLTWQTRLMLLFKPRYVQVNDGYVWTFCLGSDGVIYLLDCERLTLDVPEDDERSWGV